MKFVQASNP